MARTIDGNFSFHLRYVPDNAEDDVGVFSRLVYARGDIAVFFDEVHLIAPLHSVDPDLANLFRRGRHRGVRVVFASQRPSAVNNLLTSQANKFTFFRLVNHRDLAYVEQYLDIDPKILKNLKIGYKITKEF